MTADRKFPLQTERDVPPGPVEIPWSVAEKAYGAYVAEYGRCQSLERLAERGGFGWGEMDKLYPAWRQEVDEITRLRADLAAAAGERDEMRETLDAYKEVTGIVKDVAHVDALNRAVEKEAKRAAAAVGELERCKAALTGIHRMAADDLRRGDVTPHSSVWQIEADAAAALRPAAGDQAKGGG